MVCLEVYLLKNLCADAALLFLCGRWRAGKIRMGRILVAAALGTLGACLSAWKGGWPAGFAAQTMLAAGMVWTAFRPVSLRELFSFTATLLLCGMAAVGTMEAKLPPLLSGMAAGFGVCALSRRLKCPPAEKLRMRIVEKDSVLSLPAIVDTGNLARDFFTGLPVVLVPWENRTYFDESRGTVRIRTVGGAVRLPRFCPEKIQVEGKEVQAIVTVAPEGMLEYALLPAALAQEAGKGRLYEGNGNSKFFYRRAAEAGGLAPAQPRPLYRRK